MKRSNFQYATFSKSFKCKCICFEEIDFFHSLLNILNQIQFKEVKAKNIALLTGKMSTVQNPVDCLMKQVKELNDGCIKAARSYFPPWRSCCEQEQIANKLTDCNSLEPVRKKNDCQKPENLKKYNLSNYDINVLSPNSW